MGDNPSLSNEADDDDKPVCKDFQTGKCSRHNCKFSHDIKKLQICGDFQFGKCTRDNCKFVHVYKEEEDPNRDVCKDFQLGRCSRDRCRFRHITESEMHKELMQKSQSSLDS